LINQKRRLGCVVAFDFPRNSNAKQEKVDKFKQHFPHPIHVAGFDDESKQVMSSIMADKAVQLVIKAPSEFALPSSTT
jgi:hypothetical protein